MMLVSDDCIINIINDASRGVNETSRIVMEQHALKNINKFLNTNIYSYLETSGGQSSNLYLNVVDFFNTMLN
jgi:hypothetical protein